MVLNGFFLLQYRSAGVGLLIQWFLGIQAELSMTFRSPSQKGKRPVLILEQGFYAMFPKIPEYVQNQKQGFFQEILDQVFR